MPSATSAAPYRIGRNRLAGAPRASPGQGGPRVQLLALVDRVDHVCCRYRLAAFQSYLDQAGYQLKLRPWPRRWCSWLRLERVLRRADGVILQRKLLSTWGLYLLRRAARVL